MTEQSQQEETGALDGDVLQSPEAGGLVVRGGAIRGVGYAIGIALTAVASVFLLRYLGVADFGRYMTVVSLIAIVGGVTDAGLTAVGARDLARSPRGEPRHRLMANLVALRLVVTPLGVLAAIIFALAAGYDSTLVLGTLLSGIGLILIATQATMMLPLWVRLSIGRLTAVELIRQVTIVLCIVVLVAVSAPLLAFLGIPIVVGAVAFAVTPTLIGREGLVRPAIDRLEALRLVKQTLPVAVAVVMNVVYFRLLIILMSLLATATATGLFATSFRIYEILFGIPTLVLSVALPVLAVADMQRERLAYQLQRLSEVGLIASAYLVIAVLVLAEPLIRILGGSQYVGAAPILQIQSFALVAVFLGQVVQLGLIAVRRQRGLAVANGIALALVLALGLILIPPFEETGAAVAAVVAETALAAMLLVALRRADRSLLPSFRFAWKIGFSVALALPILLAPIPAAVQIVVASAIYAAVIWLTRAVPIEIVNAFARRHAAAPR
jgi:O-antigen/teichoic acid export membrane protein